MTKTTAIVLNSVRFGDDKMIVYLFTREKGTVPFVVHGVHSRRNKNFALFSPLSILDIEYEWRENKELQLLKGCQFAYHYSTLPYDPEKSMQAMFLAEFLRYALHHESEGGDLFDFLESALTGLDDTDGEVCNFYLMVMAEVARLLGYGMEDVDGETLARIDSNAERKKMLEIILQHYQICLPEFPKELLSLTVLRDIQG